METGVRNRHPSSLPSLLVLFDVQSVHPKSSRNFPHHISNAWDLLYLPSHDHSRQPYQVVNTTHGIGPLSWLRTNRQIYNEAKAFVQGNLTFHLCSRALLSSLLTLEMNHIFSLSTCRSLSLCHKVRIESDYSNGYKFSSAAELHGWGMYSGMHWGKWSVAAGRNEAIDLLPVLHELKLHLSFICKQAQGPRLGQVYRVKNPPKLICVDNKRRVEGFINTFCDVRQLRVLRMAKLDHVSVEFQTREVEHYTRPAVDDRRWCIGRSVDEGNLRKIKLGERIEKKLLDLSKMENDA
ncbi:hypothetical protein DL98DRAFT_512933 [Cadophora sp. DSE1049]|nr:hypothetical protein DL98DRAFT_512933 [Cadophora sp. DSE1049]